jgi:biotin synthase
VEAKVNQKLDEAVKGALRGQPPSREQLLTVLQWPEDDVLTLVTAVAKVRHHFFDRRVKLNYLLNIKSGLCPENCSYCSQARDSTAPIAKYTMLAPAEVVKAAQSAVACGAKRFCIVASGRGPTPHEVERVSSSVEAVKAELPDLEICACLGLLREGQAERLHAAGVYAYNHNLNTSSRHYPEICSTHTYEDRVSTVQMAARSGLSACSGILVGMGETDEDIIDVALDLRELRPDSVPVNFLISIDGTSLEGHHELSPQRCLKVLAAVRLVFPDVEVRIAGGREVHLRSLQPLGLELANSIFIGDYLTTKGQAVEADLAMIRDSGYIVEGTDEATLLRDRDVAELRTDWPAQQNGQAPGPKEWVTDLLAEQRRAGLWRATTVTRPSGNGLRELVDGQRVLTFTTNDYLGLASDPRLREAGDAAVAQYGSGATGSRLLSGAYPLLEELELRVAKLKNTETALVVGSGYLANLSVLQALGGKDACIFSDALNHASVIDGARLSRAEVVVYPHRDLQRLDRLLSQHRSQRAVIITDAVFGMDGTLANLAELNDLAHRYGAWLVVDDAHGTGVFGPGGAGTWAHLQLPRGESHVIHVGTFSKALGGYGAFIASTCDVRDLVLNRGRGVIFSTALPPSAAGSAMAALEISASEDWRRERVRANGAQLRILLRGLVPDAATPHPVVPVLLGTPERALAAAHQLQAEGFLVQAIRPPTVPDGTSRLRLSSTAAHTDEEIELVAAAVSKIAR